MPLKQRNQTKPNLFIPRDIITIIIMMSRYQQRYPWPFFADLLYLPLLPVGIPGLHPVSEQSCCMYVNLWLVVLLFFVHVRGPLEYVTYEFVPTSPALYRMPGSSNLDSFRDRYYLPTPPLGQDMTQGQFFKRSLTGLNSEFSFS